MLQRMQRGCLVAICLLLFLPLTGCSNYAELFRAIRNRASSEQTTIRSPGEEETETTTSRTARETTTREVTRQTTAVPTTQATERTQTTADMVRYSVTVGFSCERASVYVAVPLIEPDDAQSGPLNEVLLMRAADEQELCQAGFEDDVYYFLDYEYQFDGTCLTLSLEQIAGWVDSEGYFSYTVYHYDFTTASFLDSIAYLNHLGLDRDLIAEMVSTYAEAYLDPQWFDIRSPEEAVFVIFNDILYYEVISLEYEDYWLEEIGPIG